MLYNGDKFKFSGVRHGQCLLADSLCGSAFRHILWWLFQFDGSGGDRGAWTSRNFSDPWATQHIARHRDSGWSMVSRDSGAWSRELPNRIHAVFVGGLRGELAFFVAGKVGD